jgi:sec-independent protein translocase protein TatB
MFDIGIQELVIIMIVALLVVGPKNLPKISRDLGKWYTQLRKGFQNAKAQIESEFDAIEADTGLSDKSSDKPADKALRKVVRPAAVPARTAAQEPADASTAEPATGELKEAQAHNEADSSEEAGKSDENRGNS